MLNKHIFYTDIRIRSNSGEECDQILDNTIYVRKIKTDKFKIFVNDKDINDDNL